MRWACARRRRSSGPSVRFEQYERHTAWDRPGGVANRPGAGDLDVIIYSARKWARLALAGNPTVLLVLFVPDQEVVFRNDAGAELVTNVTAGTGTWVTPAALVRAFEAALIQLHRRASRASRAGRAGLD
jgi:RNA repair pathway DNA polymerase beta family